MIAAFFILLAGLSGAPASADAAVPLPALPAAAAPVSGIHDRAADLWRRIRTASPADPATVGALQTEWNRLKAIQREFGSDPDTHVVMRQAKQALAMLNTGVAPSVPGASAAAPPPPPTLSAPIPAQALLNSAGGAASQDGGALFDGSLASGGDASSEADPEAELVSGKKSTAMEIKKKSKGKDKPEKYHKHIWSKNFDDAALVILQKHADASASMDYLQRAAHGMAAKLRDHRLPVVWDQIKKFRFKVTNDHFIIRLKYKDHMRTSIDLGDAEAWLPAYKRKQRKSKNKRIGNHSGSLAGKHRSPGAAFAGHGRAGARRRSPRHGAAAKAAKTARADRAALDAAQLAAARAAGARALKLAKATAAGLKGGRAAKSSGGALSVAGSAATTARRGFYSHGPGFDPETFSYIAGPATRRVGAASDVASRGAGEESAPEALRDAVAAGPSVEAAASAAVRQTAGDVARATAQSASAPSAFGGAKAAAGFFVLLLALAALAFERGTSRRA